MKNFTIKKVLEANGIPHQVLVVGLQVKDIYLELKKYFYKKHSNVTWEEF